MAGKKYLKIQEVKFIPKVATELEKGQIFQNQSVK